MPHFMFRGRYSPTSIKAMVSEPQDRENAAGKLVASMGAKLHWFFFAFGQDDFIAIIEAADDTTMAAITFAVGASGGFSAGATTKLLTANEAMQAMAFAKKAAAVYEPPSRMKLNLGYAL